MSMIETVKEIAVLVQKADNVELLQRVLELQGQILELLEENHQLKARVRELEETAETDEALVFENGIYWLEVEGGERDGPFCSKCWDVDQMLVRLQQLSGGSLYCPGCERSPPGHRSHAATLRF